MNLIDEKTNTKYFFMHSRDGTIVVDVFKMDYDQQISGIARIYEPRALNPLFCFPKPIGASAIKFIMANYLRAIK